MKPSNIPKFPANPRKPAAAEVVFAGQPVKQAGPDRGDLHRVEELMSELAGIVSPDWIVGEGSDSRGHSGRVYATVTPQTKGLIDILVASKICPVFQSQSDVVRAGVWFVIKILEYWKVGKSEQVESLIVQKIIIDDILKEEQQKIDFERTFENLRTIINRHMGSGHYDHAKSILNKISEQVKLMPDGHWKKLYESKLTEFSSIFGPAR